MATRRACNFRSITKAPKAIWVITKIPAKVPVSLMCLLEFFENQQPTAVAIIKAPAVAATVLCVHSIRYCSVGNKPLGHSGQSGQVRPNPAEETYPPINISEYKTISDVNARYFKIKIISRT